MQPVENPAGPFCLKHILLLDNDTAVRDALVSVLRSENYVVVSASNDEEALRQLGRHPIDLALVDLNCGGEDRWRTIRRLDTANPRLPIILLTTLPDRPAHPLAGRAQACFSKPLLDLPSLFAKVSELSAQSSAGAA
jgi:CheY-like chemotaxis protein